ncbi:MAG TPA: hypothetical protein VGY58_04225, partial [Gemmataceae bacterium]|nr:hypothetical protein [Gemmataceae bacterium]
MSVRFLIASFVSGVLLLTTGSFLGAGEPKMITKVYPVADLVIPFDNGNLSVNLQNDGSRAEVASVATPAQIGSTPPPASREYVTPPAHAAKTCPLCPKPYPPASPSSSVPRKPAKTTEEALMKLLTGRIAPKTWAHNGGEGKIEYYPLGLAVVVTQTPEVQEQVAELLTALRRAQDTEVALEVRFVTVTDKCLARVSQDFGLAPKLCDARLGLKGEFCKLGPVFLNDAGTLRFMEAIQSSRRTTVMQAPKLTVFNGVESSLNVTDSQYFVTGLHLVPAGDQPGYVPENKPVSTGFHLSVQPAVSADRRYVTMNLNAEQTSIASVGMFPVTTYITPVFEGGAVGQPVPFTQFIQQPKLTTLSVQKTFSVPDGGTVLLTGWKPLHGPHLEKKPLVAQVLDALCPLPASAQETD